MIIDLHTHSLFSDGELLISELVWRAKVNKYEAIAITDHADFSNFDFIIPRVLKVSKLLTEKFDIQVIPGVELTYIPPELIKKAKDISVKLGAKIVVLHGETEAEPVPKNTNIQGILAKVDILAHPGRLKVEEVELAKKNNVFIEITSRKQHSLSNPYIVNLCKKNGAKMIINSDTHSPEDLLDDLKIRNIQKATRLSNEDIKKIYWNVKKFIDGKKRN